MENGISYERNHHVTPGVYIDLSRMAVGNGNIAPVVHPEDNSICHLLFCLHDSPPATDCRLKPRRRPEVSKGHLQFIFHPGDYRCQTCSCGCHTHAIEVRISHRDLMDLTGQCPLSEALREAATRELPVVTREKIDPEMDHILRQMEDHMARNSPADLFMLAKGMELMWMFVRSYQRHPMSRIPETDILAIRRAQAILENDIGDPPPLEFLAREIGMSLSKLKMLFPRVSGRTPYAYLRRVRMEHALHLLRNTDISVIDVAMMVGYASPSQFSRAFADHFGFNPSRAKRTDG